MFAKNAKELACFKALQAIAIYTNEAAHNPAISISDKIKTLQWVYRKIPEINKLLISINTEQVNNKK